MTNDGTGDGSVLPEGLVWDQPARRRRRRSPRKYRRLRRLYRAVVPARVRRWIDDNPALAAIVGFLLLLLLILLLWLLWLWLHLHRTPGFDVDLGDNRPPFLGGENILLVGLDCDEAAAETEQLRACSEKNGEIDLTKLRGDGFAAAIEEAGGDQTPFASTGVRSDVIMILHVTQDGQRAQVISIPRDSWVDIDGHGKAKINAAFSWGGPNLLGRTIEQNFKIHLTHIAVTEFSGFRGITDALGGVQVYVPEALSQASSHTEEWAQGWQTLDGEHALAYVRTRHGLPRGDFDRVQRQQNFLRSVVNRTRDMSVLANPVKVTRLVDEITGHLALGSDFSDLAVMKLTYAGLQMSLTDMSFATVPFQGAAMVGDQSVVLLKTDEAISLFDAVQRDKFVSYVADHPVESLGGETQVK